MLTQLTIWLTSLNMQFFSFKGLLACAFSNFLLFRWKLATLGYYFEFYHASEISFQKVAETAYFNIRVKVQTRLVDLHIYCFFSIIINTIKLVTICLAIRQARLGGKEGKRSTVVVIFKFY